MLGKSLQAFIPRGGKGGGKGGGGNSASIAADTLASRAYANVVLAVAEGEVQGLANGLQDVYLDGTAIENPDGTYNFSGLSFYFTPGTQNQNYVPGFADVENESQVGLEVLNSAPLVRSISDSNANAVRVTVNLPQLYYTNLSNGDVNGSSVDIAIDVQTNGGGYVQRVYDTISGKASQNYERSYLITLYGAGPWDIRVRRVTADSATGNPVNVVYWTSYTEIIDAKLSYPNTACAYLTVDSGQFQSIPTVALNMQGLRIQVPSNYDPAARAYSGAWDGTFKIAYSNNPAWCFYDLLTATRYGLGNFVAASQIDKWALYAIGQYCDELVPDGNGGQEPRFTLNCYIQNYADAFKVVQDLASVFRGMPFWATGAVTAVQDAPANAAALFSAANVIDGTFTYTGSSLKSRHTVALVTWYDMTNQAAATVEYVSISDDDIAKYGEVITQVTAMGCTSRGQAHRVGRWILYSEKYEGETVAFKTGLDASAVRPGDIIKISDPVRAGQRLGGRISAATANTVTIDSPLVDGNGNPVNPVGATLSVIAMDGSVQSATVSGAAGQTLQLSANFAALPQNPALWMLETAEIEAQLFRIIQITRSDRAEFTITALAYNPSKYGYIEDGWALEQRQITDLSQPPAPPATLLCTESLYKFQSTIFSMAALSWPAVANVNGYVVGWQRNNGNWQFVNVAGAGFDLNKTDPGNYVFQVWSVGSNGKKSSTCATLTQTLYGKYLPPSNVQGLSYGWDYNNGLVLNWEPAPDIDVASYEVRVGQDWSNATTLGQARSTTFMVGVITPGQTFWVAVLDTQGVYSVQPANVTPVVPQAAPPVVTAQFVGVNAIIQWVPPQSTLAIDHYALSMDGGNTILTTIKGTAYGTKAMWDGTENFSVAAVDINGIIGAWGSASLTTTLPVVTSITNQVVDNNVMLKWQVVCGSLPIDHYVVSEGSASATATVLGQTLGTFDTIFETVAGFKTYWVTPVDAAGNIGAPVPLTVYVNPPPDYELQYNLNSVWGGTQTNIATDTNGTLLALVDTTTSYQAHFTNNKFSSPQDQINAGFPLFLEPVPLSASYVEFIDYGQILPASSILVTLTSRIVSGAPSVSVNISVSPDNQNWTTYNNTTDIYVSNFRYAKITLNITGTSGLDILALLNLNIKYSVKQKTDAGSVNCSANDTNGTPVLFNITFLDVKSISVTPNTTTPCFATYDFTWTPAPTGFAIMLFDKNGNRLSGPVSWTVRGV